MDNLQLFQHPEFGRIRTLIEDGKTLFAATDAANALGYAKPHDAVARHCRYPVKHGVPHPQSPSKTIEMNFIPDGDLCRLAANSELPGAERFESWIFDEVIPSVLRTGKYTAPKAPRVRRKPCDIVFAQRLRMAEAFAKVTGIRPELAYAHALSEAEALTGEDYSSWQKLLPARPADAPAIADLNPTQLGEKIGLRARDVNRRLEAAGLQRKSGQDWRITEAGKAYGEEKPYKRNGHNDYRPLWRDDVLAVIAGEVSGA